MDEKKKERKAVTRGKRDGKWDNFSTNTIPLRLKNVELFCFTFFNNLITVSIKFVSAAFRNKFQNFEPSVPLGKRWKLTANRDKV